MWWKTKIRYPSAEISDHSNLSNYLMIQEPGGLRRANKAPTPQPKSRSRRPTVTESWEIRMGWETALNWRTKLSESGLLWMQGTHQYSRPRWPGRNKIEPKPNLPLSQPVSSRLQQLSCSRDHVKGCFHRCSGFPNKTGHLSKRLRHGCVELIADVLPIQAFAFREFFHDETIIVAISISMIPTVSTSSH